LNAEGDGIIVFVINNKISIKKKNLAKKTQTNSMSSSPSSNNDNEPSSNDTDNKPVLMHVHRRMPLNSRKPVEYDDLGDYAAKYPMRNWSPEGPQTIPNMKPDFARFQAHSEHEFATQIASERETLDKLTYLNIAGAACVLLLWGKGRLLARKAKRLMDAGLNKGQAAQEAFASSKQNAEYTKQAESLRTEAEECFKWRDYGLVPLSASIMYMLYQRDLLYGQLTTRVNMHLANITTYEAARYIGSEEVQKAVMKSLTEKLTKDQAKKQ